MQLIGRRPLATLALAAAAVVGAVSIIQLLSPLRSVTFARRNVPPPPDLYVSENDALQLDSFNSNSNTEIELRGRLLTLSGQVQALRYRHAPATDRSQATTQHVMGEGFLLGLVVSVTGTDVVRGQTYVRVALTRGVGAAAVSVHQLLSDYVATSSPLGWPPGKIISAGEDVGAAGLVVGTNPAAGVEISETVPTNAYWRLLSCYFILVTSAVAANRQVQLGIDSGGVTLWVRGADAPQTASTTRGYVIAPHGYPPQLNLTDYALPLPDPCYLRAGFRLFTSTVGLQAGDNFTAPNIVRMEGIGP